MIDALGRARDRLRSVETRITTRMGESHVARVIGPPEVPARAAASAAVVGPPTLTASRGPPSGVLVTAVPVMPVSAASDPEPLETVFGVTKWNKIARVSRSTEGALNFHFIFWSTISLLLFIFFYFIFFLL